jgi:subtilase family serine protease
VKAATNGIAVSGWASSPYDVAVGGTDFQDTLLGQNSTYWRATNSPFDESALSYIPEIPWNDSCGSQLLATFEGFTTTYGSTGLCNDSKFSFALSTVGGSGGPSACATGKPKIGGVVSGSCAGWPKPSWQALVGNPSDTVRDLPDVSLFASNGWWGHYYPLCDSNPGDGGAACAGAPSAWQCGGQAGCGAGGTSFSAPIMAGIQAIVNQVHGKQGNPNSVYYQLAAASYGASGNATCNSSLGNAIGRDCIFRDVTAGDMDVPCTGTYNCYKPSGEYGVLSTSDTAYQPAYGTNVGWDFATGIGTVNAAKLVKEWKTVAP